MPCVLSIWRHKPSCFKSPNHHCTTLLMYACLMYPYTQHISLAYLMNMIKYGIYNPGFEIHNNVPLQCITLHVRIVKEKYYLTVCAFNVTNACITSIAHAWWLLTMNITIPQLGLVLHVEMTFSLFRQLLTLKYKISFWILIINIPWNIGVLIK